MDWPGDSGLAGSESGSDGNGPRLDRINWQLLISWVIWLNSG